MDNKIDYLDEDEINTNFKWICLLFYNKSNAIMFGGAYDTYEKAYKRCKELEKTTKIFNIKIGELGKWLAHNPENDIQEKSTDDYTKEIDLLNELVYKYKLNIDNSINEHNKRVKDLLLNKNINDDNTFNENKIPDIFDNEEEIEYNINKISGQKYIIYSFCSPKDNTGKLIIEQPIWGIKIRGIYNSKEESEIQSNKLAAKDKYFDIVIGKYGELYTYDIDINKIKDVKYRDDKLQKIIDKHKELETNMHVKTNQANLQRKQQLLEKLNNIKSKTEE